MTTADRVTEVCAYYDRTSGTYERWGADTGMTHMGFYGEEKVASPDSHPASLTRMATEFLDFAGVAEGQMVLDAGCGTGGVLLEIGRRKALGYGINVNERQLDAARERISRNPGIGVFISAQDFGHTNFRPGSFDRVVFCESLCHAEDLQPVLREMSRVLRPGGTVAIADVFLNETDDPRLLDLIAILNRGMVVNFATKVLIARALKESGFGDIVVKDVSGNVQPSVKLAAMSAADHPHDEGDEIIKAHRAATIALAGLMEKRACDYLFVKASRRQD